MYAGDRALSFNLETFSTTNLKVASDREASSGFQKKKIGSSHDENQADEN